MRLIPHLLLVFLLAAIAESSPVAKNGKGKNAQKRKGKIAATPFLACDPPLLENPVCGAPFSIVLKEKPAGQVALYLEAPNIIFSKCRLDFTPDNWSEKQTINISTIPFLTAVKRKRVVKARICSNAEDCDPKLQKSCQHYLIYRNGGAGATCNISGDPHYNSFSRRAFGFQGLGVFYVVKSEALTIQAGLEKWRGSSASVQRRIAIRYHDTVISYNGHTGRMRRASKAKNGIKMVKNGKYWGIRLSDGSYIRIGYHQPGPDFHLSLSITLGQAYKGNTGGLCGSFATKDFVMPDGSAAKNAKGFGKSWRVEKGDNLFILGGNASSVKVVANASCGYDMRKCKIPNLKKLPRPKNPNPGPDNKDKGGNEAKAVDGRKGMIDLGDGTEKLKKGDEEVPVEKTDEVDFVKEEKEIDTIIEAKPTPPKAIKESWAKLAREQCTKVLTIKKANDILNPKVFIEECFDDLKLTGSFSFLEPARRAYLAAVKRLTASAKNEPVVNRGVSQTTNNLNTAIDKVEAEFGFEKNKCPKDCNGHGECTESGCACTGQYTGTDCSESLPKEVAAAEVFTEKESKEEDLDVKDAPEAKILTQVEEAEKTEPEMKKNEVDEGGYNLI